MESWRYIKFPETIRRTTVGRENQILSADIQATGRFPVVGQGQAFISGYSDAVERVIGDDLPLVIFGDHTRCLKYVDFPFILGADGTKVLKPEEDLFDAKFFYYALMSLDIQNRGYNRHFTLLKEKKVPRPEKDEQRKIAGVLGVVQRAIEQQERLLALTAELKKALLHKLFTEGLRGEPQKQTEIGPMPESWDMVKLAEVVDTQLGKMLSQKAHIGNDPKPYLRNKNLQWGQIDITDLLEMNFDKREQAKFMLQPGDLLVCEGGEPGRAAIWNCELKECYYQKALHRLRPKSQGITNEFLAHWLAFSFQLQNLYGIAGASSTIAHLPEAQLKTLPIPMPKRPEQDEICVALGGIVRKILHHRRSHAAYTELFRTLLHQLMTAQIRVNNLKLPELEDHKDS
jgi:type I restriction enzyme S subunit